MLSRTDRISTWTSFFFSSTDVLLPSCWNIRFAVETAKNRCSSSRLWSRTSSLNHHRPHKLSTQCLNYQQLSHLRYLIIIQVTVSAVLGANQDLSGLVVFLWSVSIKQWTNNMKKIINWQISVYDSLLYSRYVPNVPDLTT